MNDEIKEILEQLEWYRKIGKKDVYYPECVLPNKKAFILLDYITNLQQENERLKEDTIKWQDSWSIQTDKINKAIEYLDKVETLAMLDGKIIFSINIFRNILQKGSDKE